MSRYTIVVTSKDYRRLHFRTNSKTLIVFMYKCSTQSLDVSIAQSFTVNEMMVIDAYLDDPLSCEVIDNYTKKSLQLPV